MPELFAAYGVFYQMVLATTQMKRMEAVLGRALGGAPPCLSGAPSG